MTDRYLKIAAVLMLACLLAMIAAQRCAMGFTVPASPLLHDWTGITNLNPSAPRAGILDRYEPPLALVLAADHSICLT